MSSIETSVLEASLCEQLPAVRRGRAVVFPSGSEGGLVVALELDPEVLAAVAEDALALHRLAAAIQERARSITQAACGAACVAVSLVADDVLGDGPHDLRTRAALEQQYRHDELPMVRDRYGLVPGASYRFRRDFELDRCGAPSFHEAERVELRFVDGHLTVAGADRIRALFNILPEGAAIAFDLPNSVRDRLRTSAEQVQLLSPLKVHDLVCRQPGEASVLLALYGELERAGVVCPQREPLVARHREPMALIPRPGSTDLYLVFGAAVMLGQEEGNPVFLLGKAGLNRCNLVVLRDRYDGYYTQGISAEVNTVDSLVTYLGAVRDAHPTVKSTYALGNCAGSFGAILCGHRLRLSAVWALGLPDCRQGEVDLRTLLRSSNGVTLYHLYYNQSCDRDRNAAESLASFPGVRLHPQRGRGHFVANQLWQSNQLATMFPIAAPEPPGAS